MSTRPVTVSREYPSCPFHRAAWHMRLIDLCSYFCNPNFKSHIEAIPGTFAKETDKKYDGINSGQYLVQRLTATY